METTGRLLDTLAPLIAAVALVIVGTYVVTVVLIRLSSQERRGPALPKHVVEVGLSYVLLIWLSRAVPNDPLHVAARVVAYGAGLTGLLRVAAYERRRFASVRRRRRV